VYNGGVVHRYTISCIELRIPHTASELRNCKKYSGWQKTIVTQ